VEQILAFLAAIDQKLALDAGSDRRLPLHLIGRVALILRLGRPLGRGERRDSALERLAGPRLASSDLIFCQHRDEALVRRLSWPLGGLPGGGPSTRNLQ
jgi:hypothetical protein